VTIAHLARHALRANLDPINAMNTIKGETMKARQVELLCTLGPASLNDRVIHWLERAGTSLLRLRSAPGRLPTAR
jgi:hypothetical protein